MNANFKIGESICWTLRSPMDTGFSFKDFTDFINNYTDIEENAFIKGEIIYFDESAAIVVEVKEMTQDMFPFTLYSNEVRSRFTNFMVRNKDPYQRYLCLDTKSMTSLFYYDLDKGDLTEAVHGADGNLFMDTLLSNRKFHTFIIYVVLYVVVHKVPIGIIYCFSPIPLV